MSLFSSLAKHIRNNSLASVLTTIAGLVSFPVLTRALHVEDYGVMNLVASALTLAVGLGKLGMQHATLRFYTDVNAGRISGVRSDQYAPTVIYGMALLGLVATVLWVLVSLLVPDRMWGDPRMAPLMLLTAVLVQARVVQSGLTNILRAQERSGQLAVLSVFSRYVSLALVLGAVLLIAPTLWSFYGATVLAELVVLGVTLWWVFRRQTMSVHASSPQLFKAMALFAVPMTGYELASVVLQLGDRYVQQAYLSTEAVGLYSAAYNLCDYIRLATFTAMTSAAMPMVLRLSNERGQTVTEEFLSHFTHMYLCGALLIVVTVSAVRVELLSVLASAKYQAGADVIPWLITGMLCEAYFGLAGIGLYLRKKSVTTVAIISAGAALNMVLNVLLVPRLGIVGSGISNVLSCLAIVLVAQQATRRSMRPPAYAAPLSKFGALAVGAYLAAVQVSFEQPWWTLLARCVVVLFVYVGLALLLDGRTREVVQLALGWVRKARGA